VGGGRAAARVTAGAARAGETYLLLDRSLRCVVDHLAAGLQRNLRLAWPVRRIEHGARGALLHGPGAQRVRCRAVVVAVPLAQLRAGAIRFSPPLPDAKRGALARLKMSNAVKVRRARHARGAGRGASRLGSRQDPGRARAGWRAQVVLGFSSRFWPADFFDVVCTDCFIPEFWATTYPGAPRDARPAAARAPAGSCEQERGRPASGRGDNDKEDGGGGGSGAPGGRPAACDAQEEPHSEPSSSGASASGGGQATHCLVGFAAGRRAEAMSGMSESGVVLRALGQLDQIFGARRPPAPLRVPALSLAPTRARAQAPRARAGPQPQPSCGRTSRTGRARPTSAARTATRRCTRGAATARRWRRRSAARCSSPARRRTRPSTPACRPRWRPARARRRRRPRRCGARGPACDRASRAPRFEPAGRLWRRRTPLAV